MQVSFLGQENPLEEEMATHSSIPVWEIPSSAMGSQRVIMTEYTHHSDPRHRKTAVTALL